VAVVLSCACVHVWGGVAPSQVRFLVEAAELLGDARRVLMWTYAYAFFLPTKHPNRRLLEQQQGDLEKYTNHVHSEVVQFCERRAAAETATLASGDASILGRWPFKADLTTYTAAISKFVGGVRAQLKEWEDSDDVAPLKREISGGGGAESPLGWECPNCTFFNAHAAHMVTCEVCRAARPAGE
jgi:hypothetical protein